MTKVLWVADTPGWAYDNRAKRVSKLLTNYEHKIVYTSSYTIVQIWDEIDKADIVMSMSLACIPYWKGNKKKMLQELDGHRALTGWSR